MNSQMSELYGKMDAGQRKVFFFALVIVGALAFLWMPSFSSLLPHWGSGARPVIQKPSPIHFAAPAKPASPVVVQPAPVTPAASLPAVGDLLGKWRGSGPVGDRGICNFSLEVKSPQPGKFTGASTFACMPLTTGQRNNAGHALTMSIRNDAALALMLGKITPTESILSGIQEGNSITLHVDESVNAPAACGMTDLKLEPFQTNTVLVKWKEQSCAGGSMAMGKVTR